jgi:hypothetical protein
VECAATSNSPCQNQIFIDFNTLREILRRKLFSVVGQTYRAVGLLQQPFL